MYKNASHLFPSLLRLLSAFLFLFAFSFGVGVFLFATTRLEVWVVCQQAPFPFLSLSVFFYSLFTSFSSSPSQPFSPFFLFLFLLQLSPLSIYSCSAHTLPLAM